MRLFIAINIIVAAITFSVFAVLQLDKAEKAHRAEKTELVALVCDNAVFVYNDNSEKACKLAQQHTNTEYLCRGVTCWVELK